MVGSLVENEEERLYTRPDPIPACVSQSVSQAVRQSANERPSLRGFPPFFLLSPVHSPFPYQRVSLRFSFFSGGPIKASFMLKISSVKSNAIIESIEFYLMKVNRLEMRQDSAKHHSKI